MNCLIAGSVGVGLLTAAYATSTITPSEHGKLRKMLSPELADKYDQIAQERRNHYLQGIVLGAGAALLAQQTMKTDNQYHRATAFVAITLLVAIIYYQLMPKRDYMLRHLKTPEENKAWLDTYMLFKGKHLAGFLLGAVAAIPLSMALCTSPTRVLG